MKLAQYLVTLLLLTACTSPTTHTITNPQSNILYLGHQNPITVTAPGVDARDLSVRIRGAGGEAMQVSDTSWNVTVQHPGLCTLEVSGPAIGKQVFQVRPLPDPILELSGPRIVPSGASDRVDVHRTGGRLSPTEFQSRRGLTANLENISLNANLESVELYTGLSLPGSGAHRGGESGRCFSGTSPSAGRSGAGGRCFSVRGGAGAMSRGWGTEDGAGNGGAGC